MSCRALALLLLAATTGQAAPIRLRMAGVAPEGTTWAREVHGLSRDVEAATDGQVIMKWYLGAIAGDELEIIDRIKRGQLDGEAGAAFCERLAPSIRVLRLIGLLEGRDELRWVMTRMRHRVEAEMGKQGFVGLGFASFGAPILMTRNPVRSMDDLRKTRLWVWTEDDVVQMVLKQMGIPTVPTRLEDAARAYAEGKVDGFVTIPAGALAFQWSSQARYFTELPIGFLPGCLVVSQRAFDALPIAQQTAIRGAGAKMLAHFEDSGRTMDDQLLGGLFDKQGMKRVEVSPGFRDAFFSEARKARDTVAPQIAPKELMTTVLSWLADYRAEHSPPVKP